MLDITERVNQLEKNIAELNTNLDNLGEDHNGLILTSAQHMSQVFGELRDLLRRVKDLEAVVHPE
jgi:archaellum component FlaC